MSLVLTTANDWDLQCLIKILPRTEAMILSPDENSNRQLLLS